MLKMNFSEENKMKLYDELTKKYNEILNKNNLTEREFKMLFKGKKPALKFKFDDDFQHVAFYIGCDSSPTMVEIAILNIDSILKESLYENYDTVEVMLISAYCMDRIVGTTENEFRFKMTAGIDQGIRELLTQDILSKPELFCKAIEKYTRIKFDLVTIESGKISDEVIKKYPWILEHSFIIQDENIFILYFTNNFLDTTFKIFSPGFILMKDYYRSSVDYEELKNILTKRRYKKILIVNN